MKKRLAIFCVLALSMSLLSGCMHGVVVTSPSDKEFQEAWADSMEEAAEEWAQDWEAAIDEAARSWSTQDENGVERTTTGRSWTRKTTKPGPLRTRNRSRP